MDKTKQWYYVWKGYKNEEGYVHEESTYLQFPKNWEEEVIKYEVEDYWKRKDPFTSLRSYGFNKVKYPPEDWLEEEIEKEKSNLKYLKNKIENLTLILNYVT